MTKHVYAFKDGNKDMRDLLGGKGANLAEMTQIGLPVPPGFTITTQACMTYLASENHLSPEVKAQAEEALKDIEDAVQKKLGDPANPLLVSVRSGAKFSMPGMMETILNLGLNDETVHGLIAQTGDPRFAYDSYRRLIAMFGDVVFHIEKAHFEEQLTALKQARGYKVDTDLTATDWQELVNRFKAIFQEKTGLSFPQDVRTQLWLAIEAVFKSWNIPRAVAYRKHQHIAHDLGTAANIQAMVFGNMGPDSATGVAFTRNPATGEKGLYGEYLINAQGEDVVAGIRTPEKIVLMQVTMPDLYKQLLHYAQTLETHYKDMQDMEFTIEKGRLYMLQTRNGKRTAQAAVRIAVDMTQSGLISKEEALLQIDANQLPQVLLPAFEMEIKRQNTPNKLATGLGASPGAASGKIVFDPDEAETLAQVGEKVILVRRETVPDDIHGMIAAQGILTTRGGSTSHAAVVARGMGKPCVAGCESLILDLRHETLSANGLTLHKGDYISIDGATGEVFKGNLPTVDGKINGEMNTLLEWADEFRTLGVRANADTPQDAIKARQLGAKGIGLCRTEHMFMGQDRLPVMQQMIMAKTEAERRNALQKLLPMQREDFEGIFRAMAGYPVTIRLLDPPLHEFLPNPETLLEEVTLLRLNEPDSPETQERAQLLKTVMQLKESNPMLGFRGCRLGLIYPEINEMQVRAIFEAAAKVKSDGIAIEPEIMIPLVGTAEELKRLREQLENVAREVMRETRQSVDYHFGTMIEVPRAALLADEIAQHAEFFSFGTNDLTQMTFGYSRDDAEGRFLAYYLDHGILPDNPFESLDTTGVGQLIVMAEEKARHVNPNIKLGLCGEHGGEARSVAFCDEAGLNYVSCSPFRVPVARVAAAQAAIRKRKAREQLNQNLNLLHIK